MTDKKVAIVTAAGKGMGAAIARQLAAGGYTLSLMSVSKRAVELADQLGGIGLSGSVADPNDLAALVQKTVDTYGRIDAVVNNTGHAAKGPLLDIPDEDWHNGLDLLVLNVVRMARLVTPVMAAGGGGAFVNISTFAAYEPDPGFPISSSLRAALGSFAKLYADAHAADGIRMNNVLPGFIDSYPVDEKAIAAIPMGRSGTVEEIAKTVAFLLSSDAGYITGQNLRVDGGINRSV
jgi:NAD(P)-dependent dehydrogenase (short-subunit alcohol dehydrogenase family)